MSAQGLALAPCHSAKVVGTTGEAGSPGATAGGPPAAGVAAAIVTRWLTTEGRVQQFSG